MVSIEPEKHQIQGGTDWYALGMPVYYQDKMRGKIE